MIIAGRGEDFPGVFRSRGEGKWPTESENGMFSVAVFYVVLWRCEDDPLLGLGYATAAPQPNKQTDNNNDNKKAAKLHKDEQTLGEESNAAPRCNSIVGKFIERFACAAA